LIQAIGTSAAQAQFESAGPFTNASGGGSGMIDVTTGGTATIHAAIPATSRKRTPAR
jgi:hypothetical protein